MTLHSFQDGERFLASSQHVLNRIGVTLSVGSDFHDYRSQLAEGRPDQQLGAPFDPDHHKIDETNGFWVIGRDAKGRMIHTQAMRRLDLGAITLGDYMRNRFREFPPTGVDLDLGRSRYRAGPGARRMRGNACYHGEYWIGGEPGEFRGSGLSCVLGRYGFWEALNRWSPDYVFGFMQKAVAFKGFAERHGYMHSEPGALRWFIRGNETPIEGFMVYMDREDLSFILEMPLEDVAQQAA